MEDPQSLSHPFNSVNFIKMCFKSTNDFHKDQLQVKTLTINKIKTPKSKEPQIALEDEFKYLHPKLPVLEVLAHAPMYNAILDKYVDNLELGKNGSAFIQEEIENVQELSDGTKSYLVRIVKNVEEKVTRLICRVKEIRLARIELNPFKDVLVFRKMVEFQRAIPINLKGNMWESEDLIENKTDWKMPPKERDGAWHIKMEMIDPDGEKFNRIFQSLPTTRKLSEKKSQAISSTWNIFMIPRSGLRV
ncbi:hypothetical protein Tco_1279233 [Tanacetum coccineum]